VLEQVASGGLAAAASTRTARAGSQPRRRHGAARGGERGGASDRRAGHLGGDFEPCPLLGPTSASGASAAVPDLNARTGQLRRPRVEVLDDVLAHREELDLSQAAALAPWLILHGDQDDTVPLAEARALYAARQAAAPRVIQGGDHGLGRRHPFQGPRPTAIEAMNRTQAWFRRHLWGR
jgi:fermentation-respiration switch protein FrsA (DUF1100 family)